MHYTLKQVSLLAEAHPAPNPIGLCVVQLLEVDECVLTVKGLDAFEGSPIIDIKPYLSRADCVLDSRAPEWTKHGPPA